MDVSIYWPNSEVFLPGQRVGSPYDDVPIWNEFILESYKFI